MNSRYSPTGQSWGLLASLDLFGCNDKIKDAKALNDYVVELCERINMKRYGPCYVECFGEKGTPLAGYSMFQFIETSCISGHFSDSDNSAYIDVFSCSEFEPEDVKQYTMEFFEPRACNMTVLPRMYDESVRPAEIRSGMKKVKAE